MVDTVGSILQRKRREIWSVSPDTSVYDAIALMAEKSIGAVLVIADTKLVGIVSERDYARKVILQGHSSKGTRVEEIMARELVTVLPETTIDECMRIVTHHRIRHLPVLDKGNLVGIVSIGDLVNAVIADKMFAIHGKVELLKRDGQRVGTYARHYYDLYQLAGRDEVRAMLASNEYAAIKEDYDRISRAFFPRSYFCPEGMSFTESDALFSPAGLSAAIGAEYEEQCRLLCYGPYPAWAEIQARLQELRHLL